nr:unnamed protein product [Spirometra erinaceieuropaei]
MNAMLSGIPGTAGYLDDIIFVRRSPAELQDRVCAVIERVQEYGFRLRADKCHFFLDSIKRMLLGAGPPNCEKTFTQLKSMLSSNLLLTHYDPTLPIVVAADASNHGVGAVISHTFPDGSEKASMHASRTLTPAEKNYGQIEKEALALVLAVKKFHKLLYGHHITLLTDHKTLLSIFGSKKGIPVYSASRLQRWAIILLSYDYDIRYCRTTDFGQAVFLQDNTESGVPWWRFFCRSFDGPKTADNISCPRPSRWAARADFASLSQHALHRNTCLRS